MIKIKNNKKIIYLIIVAIVIFAIVLVFKLSAPQTGINTANTFRDSQSKTYTSKFLKFTINIDTSFGVEDKQTLFYLTKNGNKITIIRNGTNYTNLRDYLVNYDSRRKLNVSDETQVNINEYNATSRIVNLSNENITQKSYYIYVNNAVYILSTSSPELYSDLDQIARSFRYTP